jgi:hypothetical protein
MNATRLTGAGDMNKDGISDLIGSDDSISAGAVIFGKLKRNSTMLSITNLNLTDGFKIVGPKVESFGMSIGYAGDVNADGIADVVIGSPSKVSGRSGIYVIYGINANATAVPAAAHEDQPLNSSQVAVVIVAFLLVGLLMIVSAIKKYGIEPWLKRRKALKKSAEPINSDEPYVESRQDDDIMIFDKPDTTKM